MTVALLIVDDDENIRRALTRMFEAQGYWCANASDAIEARAAIAANDFDLVLCDVKMPGESGVDLVAHLLDASPNLAIVMVTGVDDPAIAKVAIDAGAYGYVVKPFTRNEMLINVSNALHRRQLEAEARTTREDLARTIRERTQEHWNAVRQLESADVKVREGTEEMIYRLSFAAEIRDAETARHIERVSGYCAILAEEAGLDPERCSQLRLAARLHDVGKIGIPDRVLRKPGKYTEAEYVVMRRHTELGRELLSDTDAGLLLLASDICWTHHERWNGEGYPRSLKGEEISIEGRITAVADVFDALMSKRPYKPAFPLGKVVEIMSEERERHFDPDLSDIFLARLDRVLDITEQFAGA